MDDSNSADVNRKYIWGWTTAPYDTTTMNYTKVGDCDELDYMVMGSVRFSPMQRNYVASCRYAEQRMEFLHKADAKAWVEATAKLGWAS